MTSVLLAGSSVVALISTTLWMTWLVGSCIPTSCAMLLTCAVKSRTGPAPSHLGNTNSFLGKRVRINSTHLLSCSRRCPEQLTEAYSALLVLGFDTSIIRMVLLPSPEVGVFLYSDWSILHIAPGHLICQTHR